MCGKRQAVVVSIKKAQKRQASTPGYLGGLVQGVAAEEAEVLMSSTEARPSA